MIPSQGFAGPEEEVYSANLVFGASVSADDGDKVMEEFTNQYNAH